MKIKPSNTRQRTSFFTNWRRLWTEPGFGILFLIIAVAISLFIIAPVFAVIFRSFGIGSGAWTLDYYKEFFSTTYYLRALLNSVIAAVVTTLSVTILSVVLSLYVNRSNSLLARMYRGVALLPLLAPPFIFSLSLIILVGRNGIITNFINDTLGLELSIYGFGGVILTQIIGYFPICYLLTESTMRNVNADLENASSDLGANLWRTLGRVTLPLAKSGIIKASLIIFVMALADFASPMLIGGGKPFIASELFLAVVGEQNLEFGAVLGVFLIIPSLLVFLAQSYSLKDINVATIDGESGGANPRLSKSVKVVIVTISTLFIGFIVLMFAMVILGAFVKTVGHDNTFTLEHFTHTSTWDSLNTSLIVAFFSAILAAGLGILQGYLLVRKPIPGKKSFEFLTLFGLTVPGTVMGIGYVIIFNGSPFFLTGTVLLIVLNMTFRKIGVGLEAGISKMHQINISMEEASNDLGAGPYRTFVKVVLPLLLPPFIAGIVYTFMTAMVSVSSVVFLIAPGTNLAAVNIFNLAGQAKIGVASALSFILIVIVLACMGLLKVIEKRMGVKI